jgi:hypothetical protein
VLSCRVTGRELVSQARWFGGSPAGPGSTPRPDPGRPH